MHPFLRYAHACAATYLSPANIPPALDAVGLRLVDMPAAVGQNPFYGPKDAAAMMVEDYDRTIVDILVRGTVTGRNWRTDLGVFLRRYDAIPKIVCGLRESPEVHGGFLGEWECLREWCVKTTTMVRDRDAELERSGRRLGLKGHSLGGSTVRLAAASATSWSMLPLRDIITYGEPRSGLEDFVRAFPCLTLNIPSTRIVHDDDIVPTVPPDPPYMHVGPELRLDNHGHVMKHSRNFWRRLLGLGERLRDDLDGVAVREHFMNSYIPAIELWVREQFLKDQGMA